MKSFKSFNEELTRSVLPDLEGHSTIKRSVHAFNEEVVKFKITSSEDGFHVFINDNQISENYTNLEDAEKDVKQVKQLLGDIVNEGITAGEIINEIDL